MDPVAQHLATQLAEQRAAQRDITFALGLFATVSVIFLQALMIGLSN